MADQGDKKHARCEVTDSAVSSKTSNTDGKLSWIQFFDNEKYRHHLMLIKNRQYSELLSALRQGYTISDPYKPPIELPSPEEVFPTSDHADDDITNSQSGLYLDFSVASSYPTLSSRSTYSTQNSEKDGRNNKRLTLALVFFGLVVLIAMSVTVGIVLHVHLDKEESSLARSRTDDVNKLENVSSSSSQQHSSTASFSAPPSSTSLLPQWTASRLLNESDSGWSHLSASPLPNSVSASPRTVSSPARPPESLMFKSSTFALPNLSTTTLPSSFVLSLSPSLFTPTSKSVPKYYPSTQPNNRMSIFPELLKLSRSGDVTSSLPQLLLQPTTPSVTKLSVLLLTQWLAPSLPSSETHESSLYNPAKQPHLHATLSAHTRSSASPVPGLSSSSTSSLAEPNLLISARSQSSILSSQNPGVLLNPQPTTDSSSHLHVSSLSKPSRRLLPKTFTTKGFGFPPSTMSNMYRSAISHFPLAASGKLNTLATPTSPLSTTSKPLMPKTNTNYNSPIPHFLKSQIPTGSTSSTQKVLTHSTGHDFSDPQLKPFSAPSSDSHGQGLSHNQLKSFRIPTSSDPFIFALSEDSQHPYFRLPTQSESIKPTTRVPPLMLYSPSQISGPAKLSHPSSDGSHSYMSKMVLPATGTQRDTTVLKSQLAANATSDISYGESQTLQEKPGDDLTLFENRATTSLVGTAAQRSETKTNKQVLTATEMSLQAATSAATLGFANMTNDSSGEVTHDVITSGVPTQHGDQPRMPVDVISSELFKLRTHSSFHFALASTSRPLASSLSSPKRDEDNAGNISDDMTEVVKARIRNVSSSDGSLFTPGNPNILKPSLDTFPQIQSGNMGNVLDTTPSAYTKRNVTVLTEQGIIATYTNKLVHTASIPKTLTATPAITTQTRTSISPATNSTSITPQIPAIATDTDSPDEAAINTRKENSRIQATNNDSSNTVPTSQKMATVRTTVTALNKSNVTKTTKTGSPVKLETQHVKTDITDTLSVDKIDAAITANDNWTFVNTRTVPITNKDMTSSSWKNKERSTKHRTATSTDIEITESSILDVRVSSSKAKVTHTTVNTEDNSNNTRTPHASYENNSNNTRTPHTSYDSLYNLQNMRISNTRNMASNGSSQFQSNPYDIKGTPASVGSAPTDDRDVSSTSLGNKYLNETVKVGTDNIGTSDTRKVFTTVDVRLPSELTQPSFTIAGAQNQITSTNRKGELLLGISNQTSIISSTWTADNMSMETSNQQSIGTSNQQSTATRSQPSGGSTNQQGVETSNQQPIETSNQQPIETSNQQPIETSNQQPMETSNQQPIETSNQHLIATLEQQFIGTLKSTGTSHQQSNGTSNQQSIGTSYQQTIGSSSQQAIGTSYEQSRGTSNQQSIETQNQPLGRSTNLLAIVSSKQQPTWTSDQQSNGTSNQRSIGTSNQQSSTILNQQPRGTLNHQPRGTSNKQAIVTSNHQQRGSSNQTSTATPHQQEARNQQSIQTSNQQSPGTLNQLPKGISNQKSLGTSNQQPMETINQHSRGTSSQKSLGTSNQQPMETINQHSRGTSSQKSLGTSNQQPMETINQHSRGTSNSMGTSNQPPRETPVHKLANTKSTLPSPKAIFNKPASVATSNKASSTNSVAAVPTVSSAAAPSSKTFQTPKTVTARIVTPRPKIPVPSTQTRSAVTPFRKTKLPRVPLTNATTKEHPAVRTTTSDSGNMSASTVTATTTTTTRGTTTNLDPFASYHGIGNPDGGGTLDLGSKKNELNSGVLLDYSLMLQNLPPPEIIPKAMATKIAAKPPPIPTVAPPPTPKPSEIKIVAPDVVAEIGMSPTSNLKVVCIAQKAWGWTYIAISRYEGDSEFSLEFLGGVDKSDEWPFIPIDSRMSDFTLHRDDDQVTFALETKYALCEDKGRYLCEVKVNRTFFSKTFNVDVKKRPEQPALTFPDDVFEGQTIWLVTTWDAGNPVIGYIVHDIVTGFTGLPYAATSESTKAWYKDCAVMIENKYAVTPELSWNGTEIIAHILPKENATIFERSIVERVKYDRKIMTVLDKKICDGHSNVRIAHPYRSDKYITCYSSGPSVTTCPGKNVFDEILKFCVRSGIRP